MRHKYITYFHNLAMFTVVILLLFFGWIFNSVTGWGIFYTVLFFSIIEFFQILSPLHALKGISDEQFVSCNQNGYLQLDFISNFSIFIPRFTVQLFDENYFRGEGTLSSSNFKKKTSIKVYLNQLPRGYYPELTVMMISNDYFQVWEKCRCYDQKIKLYVLPHEFKDSGKVLAYRLKKIAHIPIKDMKINSFEFKKYRKYRDTDSLKSIDWKKTAKSMKLTVRENYPERKSRNILLFWGESNSDFENGLSIFYSMYRQLDFSIFEKIYLVGEKISVHNRIDKKYFSLFNPFTDKINLSQLSKIKNRNIFIFSAGTLTQMKLGINFLKKNHNEIIQLHLNSMDSLSIKSRGLHERVYLVG